MGLRHSLRHGHGVLEWLDAGEGRPWLHFAHATGMCAEVYAELLSPLAAHFNVIASDARGHGRSELPADPAELKSWSTFQDDLAVLLDSYGKHSWLLAGHSMGASVSLELAARSRGLAHAVVMIEPAFIAFNLAEAWQTGKLGDDLNANPMAMQAARRRSHFPSRQAARDNWQGRGVFRGWPGTALDAYVAGGMRDLPRSQAELACTPAWEAATFSAVSSSIETAARAWNGGLALLYGTVGSTVALADADRIAAMNPKAHVERIEGATHFLPLEYPDRVRAAIASLASAAGAS